MNSKKIINEYCSMMTRVVKYDNIFECFDEKIRDLIYINYDILMQPSFLDKSLLKDTCNNKYYNQRNIILDYHEIKDLFDSINFFGNVYDFESINENDLAIAMIQYERCACFMRNIANYKQHNEEKILSFLSGVRNAYGERLAISISCNPDTDYEATIDGIIPINKETKGIYLLDFILKYCD